jgi:endonuclease/exonuclease/phosphatase family metal-dependent hydrolase
MRIVSWNMQGKVIDPHHMRQALHELQVDAIIIQEYCTTGRLGFEVKGVRQKRSSDSRSGTSTAALGAEWEYHPVIAANPNGQDRFLIATRKSADVSAAVDTVADTSDCHASDKRQYARITLKKGTEEIRVVTAHAPHPSTVGDDATTAYVEQMLRSESSKADFFMGDTNLYASRHMSLSRGLPATEMLSSPTSNKNDSNSLDRIYAFNGTDASTMKCGRIFEAGNNNNVSSLSRQDQNSGKVMDLRGPTSGVWTKSDHFAIYLDTKPSTANATNAATNIGAFNHASAPPQLLALSYDGREKDALKKIKLEEDSSVHTGASSSDAAPDTSSDSGAADT